jgi:chromosome segregation ATPase
LTALQNDISSTEAKLTSLREASAASAGELQATETEAAAAEAEVVALRTSYQNALSGVVDDNCAETMSHAEQIGFQERKSREAESKLKQGQLQTAHLSKEVAALKKTAQGLEAAEGKAVAELKKLQDKCRKAEVLLAAVVRISSISSTLGICQFSLLLTLLFLFSRMHAHGHIYLSIYNLTPILTRFLSPVPRLKGAR